MTNSNPNVPGNPKQYKLTDKDFAQINRRSLFGFQLGWNYERMQGSGYLYHILPQLRKMYGDNTPELKQMMKTHNQFFNTSNFFNTIVTGVDIAIEEQQGIDGEDTVAGLKTGLMGSLAAIGDSVFAALIPAIFGAIAASMAAEGNPIGIFIWVAAQMGIVAFRWATLKVAYREGVNIVTNLQQRLIALTDAATLVGVFMVGALVATMINVTIPYAPQIGEVTVDFQNYLDMIMPRMLPALIVGLAYWLLGRKNMTSTKVIWIMVILSVILSALGVLAKP